MGIKKRSLSYSAFLRESTYTTNRQSLLAANKRGFNFVAQPYELWVLAPRMTAPLGKSLESQQQELSMYLASNSGEEVVTLEYGIFPTSSRSFLRHALNHIASPVTAAALSNPTNSALNLATIQIIGMLYHRHATCWLNQSGGIFCSQGMVASITSPILSDYPKCIGIPHVDTYHRDIL